MNEQQARLMAKRVEHHRAKGFRSPEELLRFCEVFWDIKIPRQRVCPDHNCLAEYITAAWFEDSMNCVCWANRGGGKTMAGALVTWLESVFKAGCETKVLGGSGEQSLRMYNHIKKFNSEPFWHLARGEALKTYTELLNGSSVPDSHGLHQERPGPPPPETAGWMKLTSSMTKIYEAALLIPLSFRRH